MSDPFGRVFVLDRAASRSSNLQFDTDGEQFSEEVRTEIISAVGDNPPVEFISSREQKADPARQGRTGVVDDGAIIGPGKIQYNDDDTVTVGAGLWCGRDCGFGSKYVLYNTDGRWTVEGSEGPISIS